MTLHAQRKGKSGEVEFCSWLYDNFKIEVERNYNQANGHSADVITDDFIFEVKRRESVDHDSWWYQVCIAQKRHKDKIPIVAFRQNRKPWSFLIPANLINGIEKGYLIASEKVFLEFAMTIVKEPEEEEELECAGGCGEWGIANFEYNRFYCGGGPRCIP